MKCEVHMGQNESQSIPNVCNQLACRCDIVEFAKWAQHRAQIYTTSPIHNKNILANQYRSELSTGIFDYQQLILTMKTTLQLIYELVHKLYKVQSTYYNKSEYNGNL